MSAFWEQLFISVIGETDTQVSVRPTISDHGKKLDCRAAIFDAESKIIFDWKSAPATSLNVTFPPQGVKNTTVEGHLGDNITLAATFISNPMPDKLRYQIVFVIIVPKNYDVLK